MFTDRKSDSLDVHKTLDQRSLLRLLTKMEKVNTPRQGVYTDIIAPVKINFELSRDFNILKDLQLIHSQLYGI